MNPESTYPQEFDDLRPYEESEVADAMQRIAASEFFPTLSAFVFPGRAVDEMRAYVGALRSVHDFQMGVMYDFNRQVMARSCTSFACGGIDGIDAAPRIFISNHRDIVLDASLLQNALVNAGLPTAQITFGANLMHPSLVVDIGRANKMFRVERGGSPKEFYRASLHLSDYIRYVVTQRGESVWIAQRNGRTKDGFDQTDQGIIKMFAASRAADKIAAIDDLRLTPVAVSYEWEPCDVLKALELYTRRQCEARGEQYVKRPGEDLNSILSGIVGQKGRVHFEVCRPIGRDELLAFDHATLGEYHRQVARLVDRRIVDAYHLWPSNYIAHDILYGQSAYSNHYTEAERRLFVERMERLADFDVNCPDLLTEIYLGIYAGPLCQKLQMSPS